MGTEEEEVTCLYCDRPGGKRQMCVMHYQRWWRHGSAMIRKSKRGVNDCPVTPSRVYPGPAQVRVLSILMRQPGKVVPISELGASERAVHTSIQKLRRQFGKDIIETVRWPHSGYLVRRDTYERLMAVIQKA